ncbi:MAG: hypothetical protein ABSF23_06990 [Terracidiphilus sp.]|jgi:hypothetical protein
MINQSSLGRQIAGWSAVAVSTSLACFWAWWGSNENFHEGWFSTGVWRNLGLMLVQYLSPMLIVMLLSVFAFRWPRLALPAFGSVAIALCGFFHFKPAPCVLLALPLVLLAVLYHFGRPKPRRWAWICLVALPLLTAIASGAYPGWRAIHRFDDGNYGMRRVEGNGVTLVWAPEGPGWPAFGASWFAAKRGCEYLAPDGRSLATTPQHVWRLPTVDEAVRSLVFRGANAGGVWDPVQQRAHYRVTPDKDSPLWKVHSQIIYWWTATDADQADAYYITNNGFVQPLSKRGRFGYLAYRCVTDPPDSSAAQQGGRQ